MAEPSSPVSLRWPWRELRITSIVCVTITVVLWAGLVVAPPPSPWGFWLLLSGGLIVPGAGVLGALASLASPKQERSWSVLLLLANAGLCAAYWAYIF